MSTGSTLSRRSYPSPVPLRSRPRLRPPDPADKEVLTRYLSEMSRHPLLTRDEERRLARRARNGDASARRRLVVSNLRLVVKMAMEHHQGRFSLLDLIQEGNVGLMLAVDKYDPARGVKFSSYACWWIRAYLLRYVVENWRLVRLGTTDVQRKLFFKLRQAERRLEAMGQEATPPLLAAALGCSEDNVVEMRCRLSGEDVSLAAPGHDEAPSRQWACPSPLADERLAEVEEKVRLRQALQAYSRSLSDPRRQYLLEKRLTAERPLPLAEVGGKFGVSRERARQIESSMLAELREALMSRRRPEGAPAFGT